MTAIHPKINFKSSNMNERYNKQRIEDRNKLKSNLPNILKYPAIFIQDWMQNTSKDTKKRNKQYQFVFEHLKSKLNEKYNNRTPKFESKLDILNKEYKQILDYPIGDELTKQDVLAPYILQYLLHLFNFSCVQNINPVINPVIDDSHVSQIDSL